MYFKFLEGPEDADLEDFEEDESKSWILGARPGISITLAHFTEGGTIKKYTFCPISTVNTLGWVSIATREDQLLFLKPGDKIMVDPDFEKLIIQQVPRYLGDGNFLIKDTEI